MTPDEKERLCLALKDSGRTCMMCGDGANDVGALKQAQVRDVAFCKRTALRAVLCRAPDWIVGMLWWRKSSVEPPRHATRDCGHFPTLLEIGILTPDFGCQGFHVLSRQYRFRLSSDHLNVMYATRHLALQTCQVFPCFVLSVFVMLRPSRWSHRCACQ